jgi:hypothetical protein
MIAKREYAGLVLARSRITTLESQVAALIAKVGLP